MVSVNPEERKKKSGFHGSVGINVCEKKLFFEIYFFRIFKNVRRDGDDESYLELRGESQIKKSLNGLDDRESRPRSVFGASYRITVDWSRPKCERSKTDVFPWRNACCCRKFERKKLKDWM